jgi:Large polyvalent protein-associated domain 7
MNPVTVKYTASKVVNPVVDSNAPPASAAGSAAGSATDSAAASAGDLPASNSSASNGPAQLKFNLRFEENGKVTKQFTDIRQQDLIELVDGHVARQIVETSDAGLALSGEPTFEGEIIATPRNSITAVDLEEVQTPTAVPSDVAKLFRLVDGKYFFRNDQNRPAFEDLGDELRTELTSNAVAEAFIQIAEARGWASVNVEGSEEFRKQIWHHGQKAGIQVNGYVPSAKELDASIRLYGSKPIQTLDIQPDDPSARPSAASTTQATQTPPRLIAGKNITGQLVEHGQAPFMFDATKSRSYFAKLKADTGQTFVEWGVDIERAIVSSGAMLGDKVLLEKLGKKSVAQRMPVVDPRTKKPILDAAGKPAQWEDRSVLKQEFNVSVVRKTASQVPKTEAASGPIIPGKVATDVQVAEARQRTVLYFKPSDGISKQLDAPVSGVLIENSPSTFPNDPDGRITRMLRLRTATGDVLLYGDALQGAALDAKCAWKDQIQVSPNTDSQQSPVQISVMKQASRRIGERASSNTSQADNAQTAMTLIDTALGQSNVSSVARQKTMNAVHGILLEKLQTGEFISAPAMTVSQPTIKPKAPSIQL